MTNSCPHCENASNAGDAFCDRCGGALLTTANEPTMPPVEPLADEPADSWVVAGTAGTLQEAEALRLRLESAQIPVQVWDRHLNALNPWLKYALGGLRIAVPSRRGVEARRLMNETPESGISDDELSRQALEAGPEGPPSPSTLKLGRSDWMFFIAIAMVGIALLYTLLQPR